MADAVLAYPGDDGWCLWTPGDERGSCVPAALHDAAVAWATSSRDLSADVPLALGFWVPAGVVPDGTARFLRGALEPGVTLQEMREAWSERPNLEGSRVLVHGTYLLSELGQVGPLGDGVVESVTSADDDGGPVVVSHRVVMPQPDGTALICEFDTFAAAVAEEFEVAVLHLVANLSWADAS